jgi:hypothetical protein
MNLLAIAAAPAYSFLPTNLLITSFASKEFYEETGGYNSILTFVAIDCCAVGAMLSGGYKLATGLDAIAKPGSFIDAGMLILLNSALVGINSTYLRHYLYPEPFEYESDASCSVIGDNSQDCIRDSHVITLF